MNSGSELITVIDELIAVMTYAPEDFVLNYSNETSPLDLEFIYEPVIISENKKLPPEKIIEKPKAVLNKNPNYLCYDCSEKMYPVKKYYRPGNKPILVLHYNGSVGSKSKPDRSDRYIFGSPEEDELFSRMCEAAGFSMQDFHFQEFPACHFVSNSSNDTEWKKRTENCIRHVVKTVNDNKIQFLIFTGMSAQLFLGSEKAREQFEEMNYFDPKIKDVSIRAMILRSPGAILALEKKRKHAKDSEHAALLAEEKKIKTLILNSLKKIALEIT
jgi:hypothetical protein